MITKSAGHISDPEHGKAFTQSAIDEAAATRSENAQERQKRLKLQEVNDALDAVRIAALKIPGEAGKARLIDAGAAVIAGLQHHGLLTPEEGQQRSRGWVEDYAVKALKARPAKEQLETLRSLADGGADSSGSIFALIRPEQRERLAREADRDATVQAITSATARAEK